MLKEEMTMQDKPVALVTGANQGIGLQIAKDLAANGFTVLVGSRNFEKGQTAAKSVGADARAVQLDVTDQASIAAAAERIRKELGRLDVLVNNAAISRTTAGGHVRRGVRQVDPPEHRVPRRGARGVGDERVRRPRRQPGDAAAPA
jgi:NAD(P)-dependent dehydrogenase (short-subunit alcohol dehydrogenase family)